MTRLIPLPIVAVSLLALAGCGSTIQTRMQMRGPGVPAEIRRQAQQIERKGGTTPQQLADWAVRDPARLSQAAEGVLVLAVTIDHRAQATGYYLAAAELAWRSLLASGVPAARWMDDAATRRTVEIYNDAVGRFVAGHSEELARGFADKEIATPLGPMAVSTRFQAPAQYGAGYFEDFILASAVQVRGMAPRALVDGLGVALVGERKRTPERKQEMYFLPETRGFNLPYSAAITFSREAVGRRAVVNLTNLTSHASLPTPAGKAVLSGDFTAPFALTFSGYNDLLLGIRGLINVARGNKDAGIYLSEPFDKDRIPVLLIHGLSSSPLVWRNIATNLKVDAKIRKNYQFWYVFYPTGMSIPESAANIRDEVKEIRQSTPGSRAAENLAIVGYSMGGVIARILATDSGDRLWNAIATVPFDQAPLDPEDREALRRLVFWKAVPGVERVIFIATPHRGTRFADSSLAGFGLRLISLPASALQFQQRVFQSLGDLLQGDLTTYRAANGINSLSPSSPIYAALEKSPFAPGVKFDSIMGDRGRGGGENSTDGIVGFWSSHLEGAQSETIVPTGHDAQAHPKSRAAIRRILLENLSQHPARP